MNEEEKVKQEALKYMEDHSTLLRKWRDENLSMRDEFAAENTYKFSNLLISLSIGIIGGMSFLLSNINSINPTSKILSLALILPVISIILEVLYRRKVVDVNRESCNRRATFIANFMKDEAAKRFKGQPKTFQELTRITTELDEIEKIGFNEINDWIKKQEPTFEKIRSFSLGFLLLTLISIVIIIFIETSIFPSNNKTNPVITNVSQSENQQFDLDINTLTYKLPGFTKICLPETRFDCSSDGCNQSKPTVFVLYDENNNKIYRCDKNPCDGYNVSREMSGIYINLTPVTPNGSLVKLSSDNEYIETVSLGLDSIVYRGKCTDNK